MIGPIVVLGTSSGLPVKGRNTSACAVKVGSELVLFDCGEATQHQLRRAGLKTSQIKNIFLSHLHGDHINGLPGLLGGMSLRKGDRKELNLFGPPGLKRYVDTLKLLKICEPKFKIEVTEIEEEEPSILFSDEKYTVTSAALSHRIPCFGYCLKETERPRPLLVEEAVRLGVPAGPLFGNLKRGESVILEDGTVVDPEQVLGEKPKSMSFAYCTDTTYLPERVKELAHRADLLLHEATYGPDQEEKATDHGHSTTEQAAKVAKFADVKTLFLTHFSPRYSDSELEELVKQAQSIFPQTFLAHDLEDLVP